MMLAVSERQELHHITCPPTCVRQRLHQGAITRRFVALFGCSTALCWVIHTMSAKKMTVAQLKQLFVDFFALFFFGCCCCRSTFHIYNIFPSFFLSLMFFYHCICLKYSSIWLHAKTGEVDSDHDAEVFLVLASATKHVGTQTFA